MDAESLFFATTRAVHIGCALLLTAFPLFVVAVWRPGPADRERHATFCRRGVALLGGLLVVEVLSGAAWLWCVAGTMTDEPSNCPTLADVGLVLTGTRFGTLWLVRAGMAALLACVLTVVASGRTGLQRFPQMAMGSVLAGGMALAGSLAWAGHAASGLRWPVMHIAIDMVHLLAGAVWPAGLAPLVLFLITASPRGAALHEANLAVVRRYSGWALGAVFALVASGLANSWLMLPSWSAWWDTLYGRLLLAKIAVVIAMVALGALNRYRLLPALPRAAPGMVRTVTVECILALAVILIVGLLGMITPGL